MGGIQPQKLEELRHVLSRHNRLSLGVQERHH